MTTASEHLTAVDAAITKCLTAQIYTVSGRTKQMAQLSTLREFRRELIEEAANGSANGGSMASLLSLERAS